MNADDLPTLREELEAHGLWANKGLGQHFLLDLNITRRIARAAGDLAGKPVIEVGPGPGGLTRALLEAGADPLIAIEKDARFLPLLEPLVEWSEGRLRIVHGDALEVDEAALLGRRPAGRAPAVHIVSNLPYNVGTPLLVKWLKAGAWRGDMTLMFQKEVAQRIVAKPGDDAYGRLAVLAQARCDARLEFTVPARAFTPPPKIASAVVAPDRSRRSLRRSRRARTRHRRRLRPAPQDAAQRAAFADAGRRSAAACRRARADGARGRNRSSRLSPLADAWVRVRQSSPLFADLLLCRSQVGEDPILC